ncbi:MAG: hypothetical protein BM562_08030 [Alphaproteobacteria bacterium MedPE-SWcel]|nr:MAG: hypothetical protein BM562_08030 [Alphaproteobacteria bacterium MedPE-SWcel]
MIILRNYVGFQRECRILPRINSEVWSKTVCAGCIQIIFDGKAGTDGTTVSVVFQVANRSVQHILIFDQRYVKFLPRALIIVPSGQGTKHLIRRAFDLADKFDFAPHHPFKVARFLFG